MQNTGQLIVGNWKMHGLTKESQALANNIASHNITDALVVLCPPFTSLSTLADIIHNSPVQLGAQDCHTVQEGAYTGNVSASMLKDVGCNYVIVGHSERRQYHSESNELVQLKATAAIEASLTPILCIGESLEERNAGKTLQVIEKQVENCLPKQSTSDNTVIAYEPVWAIGSGKTPSIDEIEEIHTAIRSHLTDKNIQILYGGSVKPENASKILEITEVDGVLVGGASLDAKAFCSIIDSSR